MIRCPWCGARNYAIDMWCSRCHHYLDWAPPARRDNRLIGVLAAAAAAVAVAMAVALPAASWFNGSVPAAVPALPNTAHGAPTALPKAQPASTTEPSASPQSAPAAQAIPPAAEATPPLDTPTNPPLAVLPALQAGGPGVEASAGDPAGAVTRFYEAVSAHEFDLAASLWTAHMQAQYPPTVFIDERFSATQRIGCASERVLSDGNGVAVVYVDVRELIGGEDRRWVGTWQLIDTPSGWLLDQPNLEASA